MDEPQKLLSRDFILLFLLGTCSNCYLAIFYCLEQWLASQGVDASTSGVLIAALPFMVLFTRPVASWALLGRDKMPAMVVSIGISSLVMLTYPFVQGPHVVALVFCLRVVQGIALAVYSSCTVAVLVSCIPPGQSARGFALFSLTLLLPFSIIPAVAEQLLAIVGSETRLFAWSALLGLPALAMLLPLASRLRAEQVPGNAVSGVSRAQLWHSVRHSGLFFVFLACMLFSIMTNQAIIFMKGLCSVTGGQAGVFFTIYTCTIMLLRLACSRHLDKLQRYPAIWFSSLVLGVSMAGIGFGPAWGLAPFSCMYGLALGLLYPLLAAVVYDRSLPETRSLNSNVMMATFDASGVIGPILGGMVVQFGMGYRGVFATNAAAVLLCGLCMVLDWLRVQTPPQSKA